MLLFYIVGIIEFLLLFIFVANEKNLHATVSVLGFALLTHFGFHIDLFNYVKENWFNVLLYSVVYVAAGLVWSFPKWFFFLRNMRDKYLELKKQNKSESYILSDLGVIPPLASQHKTKIIGWISYWPISIVWTLLDDFITKIFTEIFNLFSGLYQKMSDSVFKKK